MKSIVEKINESIVNEVHEIVNEAQKIKPVNTTVGRYVAWYFGVEDIDYIDPFDDFESTDFDPESLEKDFKGSYAAQYEFLSDSRDEKIKVEQIETDYGDIEATFKVGKVVFHTVSTDIFKK